CFFFSSRRRHTRWPRDWSSDVCSSDLLGPDALDWQAAVKHEFEVPVSGLDTKASAALAQIASAYESMFNDPSALSRLQRMIASAPQTLSIPNPQRVLAEKQDLVDRLSQVRSLLQ